MVGSFLNVVIHRLPRMMETEWKIQASEYLGLPVSSSPDPYNLAVPRSACPGCGHKISAWENIPVLSYLFLRGRCRECRQRISYRYPAVELLSGLLSAYAAWHFGWDLKTLGALLFLWSLIALAFIDLDTQLLPDSITLPLLWLGLLFNLNAAFVPLNEAVIGAVAGYLCLWSVYWVFKLVTGKEGMGFGDFKLLAAIGAWLGWKILPMTILLSSLAGACVGIALILFTGRGKNRPIPFGPYLAIAGLLVLFWGNALNERYLSIL